MGYIPGVYSLGNTLSDTRLLQSTTISSIRSSKDVAPTELSVQVSLKSFEIIDLGTPV